MFRKLFGQSPGFPPRLVENLECFFSLDCMRPSLRDIILAHAMVTHRKCLTWADLLRPDLTITVPDRFYECSLAVFELIVGHLQGIERELAMLRAERDGIAWLQGTEQREKGEIPKNLSRFYDDLGRSWHADSGDVFLIQLALIGGLVGRLRELCSDAWQVMTVGEKIMSIRVVDDATLPADIEKIAALHEAAGGRHQLMAPEEISLFRYREAADRALLLLTENQKFVSSRILMSFSGLTGSPNPCTAS